MPEVWEGGTKGGMHRVSTARAQIGTDVYELCSRYASGLLEGSEDGRLSKWVRVQVPFGWIRQRPDQNGTIIISVWADGYVTVLDVYQLCGPTRNQRGRAWRA